MNSKKIEKFKQLIENIIDGKIKQLIEAGGEASGNLELASLDLKTAKKYIADRNLEVDNFDKNFVFAKKMANMGRTQRKDMPVIDDKDVTALQNRLANGYIDINKPESSVIKKDIGKQFPEGLSGEIASKWLEAGLKKYDGSDSDDVVTVKKVSVPVYKLKPIQKQIYFDKSIDSTAKFGVDATKSFLKKTFFITSSDNFIIDGHHRWLSGILVDPKLSVTCLQIDLPINKLLPMATAYGDAIGNTRNA